MLFLLLCTTPGLAETLFRVDFDDLTGWKHYTFPKIPRHTRYDIVREGGSNVLRAESDASASALIHDREFDPGEFPRIRWRWKVESVYAGGDPLTKSGDDYPLRVYVLFPYDPGQAGAFERLRYGLARKIYGEYPPHSTLNYVWASREHPRRILPSPYTDRAMLVLLRQGSSSTGEWLEEEVDILSDYKAAFGEAPPRRARIAVMNDSDNTGERSVAFLDFIEVFR
jgi:hypothetical protein